MLICVDVPKELDVCVKAVGGTLLDDMHGSNDPTKADYWFPEENVIGELKCLSNNYFDDHNFTEWLNNQYREWVRRNLAKPIVRRAVVNLAQLPPVCAHEVASFLRKRLDGSLSKANSQIKNSRKELRVPSALGLLILVNDGNTALPPGMIQNIVARTLPNKFSSINSIIHFTANMPSSLSRVEKDLFVWCVWNVQKVRPAVPEVLLDRLRDTWFRHFATIVGEPVPTISGSVDDLYDLKFPKR
jgi:hypothetical protein